MAFKTKINPSELVQMTYKDYEKAIKKEIAKAQKFGQTEVIIFSDFQFACGKSATMLLLGQQSGALTKFYKQAKKDRKKENDFAKGVCYFESKEGEATTLHIALNDGKGKPVQMKKNGKSLFKKIGLLPNIFKGDLPAKLLANFEGDLNQEEIIQMSQEADKSNDHKAILLVFKQYQKALKQLTAEVLPLIQMKENAPYKPKHLEIAKKTYFLSLSFLDKYEEVNEARQAKFADKKARIEEKQPLLRKIAAKIKKELSQKAEIHGSSEEMETVFKNIDNALEDLKPKFQKALDLVNKIITKKK